MDQGVYPKRLNRCRLFGLVLNLRDDCERVKRMKANVTR